MQNIYNVRKKLDSISAVYKHEITNLDRYQKELLELDTDLEDHKKVREVYQQAAVFTQEYLEEHISSIVTNAIKSVFYEKDIRFQAKFDKKRNSSECTLSIFDGEEEYDILEDKGFGVADIASFALRCAYILLDSVDNVLIMDEPFRNLDKDRTPYASKMIAELSKKLNIQFIIITHVDDLVDAADNVIVLKMKNKRTEVVE
jgi:DNA repair exonuclease SbcCD ATPase subunit